MNDLDSVLDTLGGYFSQTYIGAIVFSGFVTMAGLFLWRLLVRRVEDSSADGQGGPVKIAKSVKNPGYAVLTLVGLHLFLALSPAFRAKAAWILGTRLLTAFGVVILLGESVFAFFVDYYLSERRGTGVPTIFKQLLKGIIYLIVGLSFLSTTYKIDITPLLTTSAVFTMVIGLALQDVLGNLFAGISVHISPPFKLGDWITLETFFGKVIESNWRATTLETPSKETIIIPNNDISKKDVINHSFLDGILRREFSLGLSYETSPENARKHLLAACSQVPGILSRPQPEVFMEQFQDFSISYRIRYWIDDQAPQFNIQDKLASRIWYRLKREGLVIPFPIRDVYLHPEKDTSDQVVTRRFGLISEIDFLKNLDRKHLIFISQNLKEAWYESGESIVRKEETGTDFFIIDQGRVSVFLDENRNARVAELKERDFFGEMSLLTGEPRSAYIDAEVETKVLVLKKDVISHVLTENPETASALSEALAARHAANLARKEKARRDDPRSAQSLAELSGAEQSGSVLLDRIRRFFRLR
jgi:small-conductance mechanosensitive channel